MFGSRLTADEKRICDELAYLIGGVGGAGIGPAVRRQAKQFVTDAIKQLKEWGQYGRRLDGHAMVAMYREGSLSDEVIIQEFERALRDGATLQEIAEYYSLSSVENLATQSALDSIAVATMMTFLERELATGKPRPMATDHAAKKTRRVLFRFGAIDPKAGLAPEDQYLHPSLAWRLHHWALTNPSALQAAQRDPAFESLNGWARTAVRSGLIPGPIPTAAPGD